MTNTKKSGFSSDGKMPVLAKTGLILLWSFLLSSPPLFADGFYENFGQVFYASFDDASLTDFPKDIQVDKKGGRLINDGIKGKAFQLNGNECLTLDAQSVLPQSEGTLMMWVRPHWGYYDAVEDIIPVSHTFMSFNWNDGGYFVFSDGWWEIKGAPYTWIVADNRMNLHAHSKIQYEKDKWIHLACSYKMGPAGYVRLFRNAEMVDEKRQFFSRTPLPVGKFFVGSDQGTDLAKNRWVDSDIDELVIFNKALEANDILSICKKQVPDCEARFNNWTGDVLNQPYTPPRDQNGVIKETRAIFDEGTGWVSPLGMRETLNTIEQAGFNVYVPCVWHGKGVRYPSGLAPSEENVALPEKDPLALLIKTAHEKGIQVHPWFCVALRQRLFFDDYYSLLQTPASAFDLHRPEFRKFMIDLILDVIRRYDVDGINLDYIRSMGVCTCTYCKKAYKDRFGRDLLADQAFRPENGRMATHLQKWQDDAVASIVKEISQKGKAIRPGLVISVDGHPKPKILPPSWEGRREIKWAKSGWVDVIYNMDYTEQPDFEKYDLILDELDGSAQLIMLISNYDIIYKRNISRKPEDMNDLIGYIQRKYHTGVGVYIYSMMNTLQVKSLGSQCFKEKAVPFSGK
ncbi:MAG: family 10 glycosylhydrolase [Proteobacteria bacterium]|nr:family 10 glycosylhydrolase [Pseudomonadota bacterium]